MARSYPIQGSRVRVSVPHPFPEAIHMASSARVALRSVGARFRMGTLLRWR